MPIPPFKKKPAGPRLLSLALQGGGAHGAFEWGILDRLLEEDDIEIRAVTAASAIPAAPVAALAFAPTLTAAAVAVANAPTAVSSAIAATTV